MVNPTFFLKNTRQIIFGTIVLLLFSCSNDPSTKIKELKSKKEKREKTHPRKVNSYEENKLTTKKAQSFLKEYGEKNNENLVLIKTKFGNMKVLLYKETPLHRANFLMLTKKEYFTGTVFYRVVKDFIIQGGNTDQDETMFKRSTIGDYKIKNEINPKFFHKKGALAAARGYEDNPTKISDPYNFYIVHGEKLSDQYLDTIENRKNVKFPNNQRYIYKEIGGTPHLDGEHTIFGEVIEGFEVIDKIANVEIDNIEWPLNEIVMEVNVIKD